MLVAKFPALGPVARRRLELLDQRLRRPPVPDRHLRPDSATESIIKRMQRENDEVEAGYARARLARVEGQAANAFDKAGEHGRARYNFARAAGGIGAGRERDRSR
jgi:hypothetical protein